MRQYIWKCFEHFGGQILYKSKVILLLVWIQLSVWWKIDASRGVGCAKAAWFTAGNPNSGPKSATNLLWNLELVYQFLIPCFVCFLSYSFKIRSSGSLQYFLTCDTQNKMSLEMLHESLVLWANTFSKKETYGVRGSGGGRMETTVLHLNNNKKK